MVLRCSGWALSSRIPVCDKQKIRPEAQEGGAKKNKPEREQTQEQEQEKPDGAGRGDAGGGAGVPLPWRRGQSTGSKRFLRAEQGQRQFGGKTKDRASTRAQQRFLRPRQIPEGQGVLAEGSVLRVWTEGTHLHLMSGQTCRPKPTVGHWSDPVVNTLGVMPDGGGGGHRL